MFGLTVQRNIKNSCRSQHLCIYSNLTSKIERTKQKYKMQKNEIHKYTNSCCFRENVFLTSRVGERKRREWSRRLSTLSRSFHLLTNLNTNTNMNTNSNTNKSLSRSLPSLTNWKLPPLKSSWTWSPLRTPPSRSSWTRGVSRWSAKAWTQTTQRGEEFLLR